MAFPDGYILAPINSIKNAGKEESIHIYDFASRNKNKEKEFSRLGLKIRRIDLEVPEVQHDDPDVVLEAKAREAFKKNSGPILVEDTSLTIDALDNKPGPYADAYTKTETQRRLLCASLPKNNRGGRFRVGLAISPDGIHVLSHVAEIQVTIATKLRGSGFGFDDMVEPVNQVETNGKRRRKPKTFAEMSAKEKDTYSPRRIVVEMLKKEPFFISDRSVYALPEVPDYQMDLIDKKAIAANQQAVRFARHIDGLKDPGNKPSLMVSKEELLPIHRQPLGLQEEVVRYTTDISSGSQGLIILSHGDTKLTDNIKPKRILASRPGEPFVFQMTPKAITKALSSRAVEFALMHSDQTHQRVLDIQSGKVTHVPRPHTRSETLEDLLEMRVSTDGKGKHLIERPARNTVATASVGYPRMFSDHKTSRKAAANYGLFIKSGPIPSSIFSLGGMPMTSGSADTIATAASSYMRSWIPHNGFYAASIERQIGLFKSAKQKLIDAQLPPEIFSICLAQIGLSVASENPEKIADEAMQFQKAGGSAIRIYTTNPNIMVVDTAKAIRAKVGPEMLICVGPIVNTEQAKMLKSEADVRMFLVGHGGGETCTSLKGGGAANAITLLYELYLDTFFDDCIIGTEGGVGDGLGPLLPMADTFSLNQSGVRGGFEITGGIYVKHASGDYCLPNHGSASAFTQAIEALIYPDISRKRLSIDGKVINIEGKPNYSIKHDADSSIVDAFRWKRGVAGTALADLQSLSIYELREKVAQSGSYPLVKISPDAYYIAGPQRQLW